MSLFIDHCRLLLARSSEFFQLFHIGGLLMNDYSIAIFKHGLNPDFDEGHTVANLNGMFYAEANKWNPHICL